MTVFVERRAGAVVGVYAVRQPGYAEEEIADDHPEVVAFRDRPSPAPRDLAAELDALAARLARQDAIEAVLVEKGTLTKGEVDDKLPRGEAR